MPKKSIEYASSFNEEFVLFISYNNVQADGFRILPCVCD